MMDDFDGLQNKISQMINETPELVKQALWDESNIIFNKSQELCPIDTGRLRNSGRVTVQDEDYGMSASITYSTDYAIYVHEDLTKAHKFPTQAKFLEEPARERSPELMNNISKRVERMLSTQ